MHHIYAQIKMPHGSVLRRPPMAQRSPRGVLLILQEPLRVLQPRWDLLQSLPSKRLTGTAHRLPVKIGSPPLHIHQLQSLAGSPLEALLHPQLQTVHQRFLQLP